MLFYGNDIQAFYLIRIFLIKFEKSFGFSSIGKWQEFLTVWILTFDNRSFGKPNL